MENNQGNNLKLKVALVHDHLAQDGGAEAVLRVFTEIFPEAPIYTLLYEEKNAKKYYAGKKIYTSIIQKLPGGVRHYQWYMPFMPMAIEFFDLSSYDLVLSDSSSFAKGVITPLDTLHVCYCHTPTRYLWDYTHKYISELKYNKYFKKLISLVLNYVRVWDRTAADRVDRYIANSKTVRSRISKYYRQNSTLIYPPVELDKFYIAEREAEEKYFLAGCRLNPYKRIDIVIEAFKDLGLKLKVFGDGPDMPRLKKIAGAAGNIEFLGRVDDEKRAELYALSQAFIHPQDEDFGITVVEAQASGRPVLAFRKSGATETVIEGMTGEFFDEQTATAIVGAVKKFDAARYDPGAIRGHALKFSKERFKDEIVKFIEEEYGKFRNSVEGKQAF
ncbi:MAG: glycosyltransferase [Candidatus Falkowbacteria bacterium]